MYIDGDKLIGIFQCIKIDLKMDLKWNTKDKKKIEDQIRMVEFCILKVQQMMEKESDRKEREENAIENNWMEEEENAEKDD